MLRSILRRSDNPQRSMQHIQGVAFPSVTRVFADFTDDPFFAPFFGEPRSLLADDSSFIPLDISEDEKAVIVRATLPGFTKDEIHVEVKDGVLSIHAHREDKTDEGTEKYHRRERRFGTLSRQTTLPASVIDDQAKAELKDGVLTLRLPKVPEPQPRKINID